MRGIQTVSILLIAFGVASCSDDAPTNNTGNGGTFKNEVSAMVNGATWTATSVIATRNDAGGLVILTFVAHGPNGSHIDFGIANASVKPFTIDGSSVQAAFEIGGKTFGHNQNATGSITVSELTTKGIKGSFDISAQTSSGEAGTATGSFEAAF